MRTKQIYSFEEIKSITLPILIRFNIKEAYLFGSYSRGEATCHSDIGIYCEKGNIKSLLEHQLLIEKLEKALGKNVDTVFTTAQTNELFLSNIKKDLISLF